MTRCGYFEKRWKKPMIKAILLDLDDTLLGNPTEAFVRNYLALLDAFLERHLGLVDAHTAILAATDAVIHSDDPRTSNLETFYAALLERLTVDRATFQTAMDVFYREVYPDLAQTTQPHPGVHKLVEALLARGLQLVVATNPFFPRVAIEQRLAWAGVPTDTVPFALVTTLENMHYTKPHPAYYEEALARIGVQADEAVMVGNHWQNDIMPAHRAGLHTFWVCMDGDTQATDMALADGHGSLADFACLVQDEGWLETLTPSPHRPAQIAPRLNGNLAALLGVVEEAPAHVWTMRPVPNEWTPMEVLCHLAESEREVQRPRLERIVREDNPFLSQPKQPPPPAARLCPEQAHEVALTFADERERTLAFLAALPPQAWARAARHYIFGPTTLLEMANFVSQHDRMHITQLCQTIGKCL